MNDHIIIALHISDRVKHAVQVQQVLTEFGCNIKTRLGLHETGDNACSPNGLVFLETCGELAEVDSMQHKLEQIEGLDVQRLTFAH